MASTKTPGRQRRETLLDKILAPLTQDQREQLRNEFLTGLSKDDLIALSDDAGLVRVERDLLTGGIGIFGPDGEIDALSPSAGTFSLVGPNRRSLTFDINHVPDNTDLRILGPLNLMQSTSGLTYALTAAPAQVTGAQSLVLPEPGTYALEATVKLAFAGATFAAIQAATAYLRRTNNTAADIGNSSASALIPAMTTMTLVGNTLHLGPVIYTTSNADDAIAVFASLTAAPSAGACNVTNTHITARRS